MGFDYERRTRGAYQDVRVAKAYRDLYATKNGWRNLPARVVTRRERRTVADLIGRVPHRRILDLPAGSGKLAVVLAACGSEIVAADISESMLRLARAEYARIGYRRVSFTVADAVDLDKFAHAPFDLAVCLRLLHRVPCELRRTMLAEIASVAPYAIVSYGIENSFHKARRVLRKTVFSGHTWSRCSCSMAEARTEVESSFEIVERAWIAPVLSQELIFLLRSKAIGEHAA